MHADHLVADANGVLAQKTDAKKDNGAAFGRFVSADSCELPRAVGIITGILALK